MSESHSKRPERKSSGTESSVFLGSPESLHLELQSNAFAQNQPIPPVYSRSGANVSPPLRWSHVPKGTRSLAIICDDADATKESPAVHWVIYNIPPLGGSGTPDGGLPGAVGRTVHPFEIQGAVQGKNSLNHTGYDGPDPPPGHGTHHYHFKMYALDSVLHTHEEVTRAALMHAMRGHILACGVLVGTFSRT